MIIDKIVEPYFGENMYILIDEETKKCAVVDPGGASDKILTYLKKNSLELEYILLTHGHGDHIGAVNYIKSKTNATIVAHSDEKELLNDNRKNLSYSMHCGPQELNADVYVNDKDTDFYSGDYKQIEKSLKKLAKFENKVKIHPGHGPSSTLGIEKMSNPYM